MDTRTGEITNELQELKELLRSGFGVPVTEEEMTAKQKREMQVSPFDNRSPLGKIENKYRNRPCPCGSGRKLKKCCMLKRHNTEDHRQ